MYNTNTDVRADIDGEETSTPSKPNYGLYIAIVAFIIALVALWYSLSKKTETTTNTTAPAETTPETAPRAYAEKTIFNSPDQATV